MDPAAISARPATMIMCEASTAPVSPAAKAKGTVRPSAMPITMSRTTSDDWKCFSTCAVRGKEFRLEISASIRLRYFGNLFRRAFGDDAAATVAALGAEIDHPVRTPDHLEVVLDDQDAAARAQQALKGIEQFGNVVEMQSGSGLVEDVKRALARRLRQVCGE